MRERAERALTFALSLLLAGPVSAGDAARHLDSYTWSEARADFGGLSGMDLSEDGAALIAVSDRGKLISGTIQRQGDRITGVSLHDMVQLKTGKGATLPRPLRDAEGLAQAPGGALFVSFEGPARVARLRADGRVTPLPAHPDFAGLHPNSALEALAVDAQGQIYTLPERSGALDRPFRVWRWNGRAWDQPFAIPRDAGFLPVGADFGPDGRFYLLERGFNGIGFRTRVRSFDMTGDLARDPRTHLETWVLRHDNLEGLSVWRDEQGRIRLTMISDDNFRAFQRTELVDYVIE